MTDDLFDQNEIDNIPNETDEVYTQYVKERYGEDAPPQIAKAIFHKDKHIEQIHRENEGVRQELESRIKMEEFLDRLNNSTQDHNSNALPQDRREQQSEKPALTAEDVKALLDQRDRQAARDRNLEAVKNTLLEKLGPNYPSKAKQIISNLRISEQRANELAAESPEAFYKLIGLDAQRQELFDAPPRSAVNTEGFKPTGGNSRDYTYYEDLRKKDPTTYWSPKIQNEMFQMALRQGEQFGHNK